MDKYFVGLIPDENSSFNQLIKKKFNTHSIHWFKEDAENEDIQKA